MDCQADVDDHLARFPVEILEQIIIFAWEDSTMPVNERIQFMVSSMLVNKAWLLCYLRASSTHIHIPCSSYFKFLETLLFSDSPIYKNISGLQSILAVRSDEQNGLYGLSFFDRHCRSMTVWIQNTHIHPPVRSKLSDGLTEDPNDDHPASLTLGKMLHYLSPGNGFLPGLRRIHLRYLNRDPSDPIDWWRFVSFPDQVTELEIVYQYDARTPPHLLRGLRSRKVERMDWLTDVWTVRDYLSSAISYRPQWTLPLVNKITILGGNEEVVLVAAARAECLKELVCDVPIEQSDLPGVRITVVENSVVL